MKWTAKEQITRFSEKENVYNEGDHTQRTGKKRVVNRMTMLSNSLWLSRTSIVGYTMSTWQMIKMKQDGG